MIDIFVIDPPWPQNKGGLRNTRPNQNRSLDYSTMSIQDIFYLLDTKIFNQASPIHAVFLWEIDKFLIEAENEMLNRGYKRHCRFIWDKTNGIAPAFTVRFSHEYLVWWYKPKMLKIDEQLQGKFKTVFSIQSREHSRKPNEAYIMIDQLYPKLIKMDVFSRENRDGWLQYGNQIEYFNKE